MRRPTKVEIEIAEEKRRRLEAHRRYVQLWPETGARLFALGISNGLVCPCGADFCEIDGHFCLD